MPTKAPVAMPVPDFPDTPTTNQGSLVEKVPPAALRPRDFEQLQKAWIGSVNSQIQNIGRWSGPLPPVVTTSPSSETVDIVTTPPYKEGWKDLKGANGSSLSGTPLISALAVERDTGQMSLSLATPKYPDILAPDHSQDVPAVEAHAALALGIDFIPPKPSGVLTVAVSGVLYEIEEWWLQSAHQEGGSTEWAFLTFWIGLVVNGCDKNGSFNAIRTKTTLLDKSCACNASCVASTWSSFSTAEFCPAFGDTGYYVWLWCGADLKTYGWSYQPGRPYEPPSPALHPQYAGSAAGLKCSLYVPTIRIDFKG